MNSGITRGTTEAFAWRDSKTTRRFIDICRCSE